MLFRGKCLDNAYKKNEAIGSDRNNGQLQFHMKSIEIILKFNIIRIEICRRDVQ